MSDREAYVARLQSQVDRWQGEIHSVKAQASAAEDDDQSNYGAQIRELEENQATAQAKIDELRDCDDERYDGLLGDFQAAWEGLEETMAVALGRFHNH